MVPRMFLEREFIYAFLFEKADSSEIVIMERNCVSLETFFAKCLIWFNSGVTAGGA